MDTPTECPLAPELARRLREARDDLTRRWLERIVARVSVDPKNIFPTEELLDHVPLLIDGIADYMEDPAEEISADVPVIAKAMELGEMRQAQGFGAYEILKEYELLGSVIFSFLVGTVDSIQEECSRSELLSCGQRLFRAIAVIQQVTTVQFLRQGDAEVREREERLRGFNRMVTHELKNRISAVLGASSILAESWADIEEGERERFLSIIRRSAQGMQATLEDLLTITHADGDARQQRHVRLPEAVNEVTRQLRDMASEREVSIRVADDLPPVEVDAAAVELSLVNYISNGIKYSDPKKRDRWVEVRAYRSEEDQEVVVEVRDNGIGVPPPARERVFERFYRADTVSDVEGTGLGLSIVAETVKAVGGRAWGEFDEGEGGGAIFKIAVPARRSEDEA